MSLRSTNLSRRGLWALAASLTLLPVPAFAGGGGLGGLAGATLPEQIVQEGTLANQLTKQAEQVRNQLQQIAYQVRNLKTLPMNIWPQVRGELDSLTRVVSRANGLSYAMQNVNGQFASEYPIYTSSTNYNRELNRWNQTTSNSVAAALQNQHLQAARFASQQSALNAIEAASQSATGRMQALQAGNQISAMEVHQLQALRQMQMANSDAQMAYIKQRSEAQTQQANANQQAYDAWADTPPKPPTNPASQGLFSDQ